MVGPSDSFSQELAAGNSRAAQRDFVSARSHFLKAVQLNPASAEAHSRAGYASWMLQNINAALHHYKAAAQIEPVNALTHEALSEIYLVDSKGDLAVEHARKALELSPNDPEMAVSLGLALEATRQKDAAMQIVQRLMSQGYESTRVATLFASLADSSRRQEAVELAQRVLNRGQFRSPLEPGSLEFTIASLLDKMGQYDQAFAHARRANELRGAKYDAQRTQALVDQMIGYFTRHRVRCLPRASHGSRKPVFIVGMFRSGSTLVEQILAGHSGIEPAGELELIPRLVRRIAGYPEAVASADEASVRAWRESYLAGVAPFARDGALVTDKRPDNFLHIGLIKTLFPDAKIVHTRRNRLDNLLSLYFLHLNPEMAYALDLDDAAHWYGQYERLMAHWKALYPHDIIDLDYDELVRSPEPVAKRLLEFLGLGWEDSVLDLERRDRPVKTASVWQVRQPMHTRSSGRWRNYSVQLQKLIGDVQPDQ